VTCRWNLDAEGQTIGSIMRVKAVARLQPGPLQQAFSQKSFSHGRAAAANFVFEAHTADRAGTADPPFA